MKFDFDVPPTGILTGFTLKPLAMRPAGDETEDAKVIGPLKP